MNRELPTPPAFWTTVRLLLSYARKRASGRERRQKELLQQRSSGNATDWGAVGFVLAVLFMAFLNGGAAFVVRDAVQVGKRVEVERQGKIVVNRSFLDTVLSTEKLRKEFPTVVDQALRADFSIEAQRIADHYGGEKSEIEQRLRNAVLSGGTRNLITRDDPSLEFSASLGTSLPTMLGSVALFWWAVMLVFQGEGLEMDLQRRRHPMWEWLFSHPVPTGAVFLAEMLSPIAANPMYWSGPLFVGFMYGFVYDPALALLAALLIGIPVTIAAACLGKALEIGVVLRFPPRSRGALMGIMSWLGYASMMFLFLSVAVMPKIVTILARFLTLFSGLPWPWLRLFLGGQSDGSFSFLAGMLTCWLVAALTIAGSVWFSVWGTQRGLAGNVAATDSAPSTSRNRGVKFGREPLYRKEFLWFIRDRSAVVQAILIPLTMAGVQVFNLRGLLSYAEGAWNYLCGVGILFGTYFLWILGPKSLTSEGTALWVALTWPRGLEALLKAKAWLWSMISSAMVVLVLLYAAYIYPAHLWKIALVGIGWFVFSRSMAEKTVTLVSIASASGEREPVPWARRGAAQLGMLTFCVGVLTQQWHIAVMGIVYSYITAAAMWQNFRARLPYLYDPWSEQVPPPPTLMHAMIAISIMVEGGAVLTGIVLAIAGRDNVAVAQAISYAISSVVVSVGTVMFLDGRGVVNRDVWRWETDERSQPWRLGDGSGKDVLARTLPLGAVAGGVLGMIAIGYRTMLSYIPAAAEILRKSQEQMAKIPDLKLSFAVMAVAFAPFAEEYLFRGLLYRALDREWGGWRAVVGSAAFFAIYHAPLSWFPVTLLGVANAILFKKTGRLAPAVILHMVYNAVVLT